MPKIIVIPPDPHCQCCHGRGVVTDWVDYGSTVVPLDSTCDCVLEQLPDDETEFNITPYDEETL